MSTSLLDAPSYRPVEIDRYRLGAGSNAVLFVEMAAPVRCLPISPTFMLGALDASDTTGMFSTNQTGPAGYYVVRNAVLTHDGIILHDGNLMVSLLTNFPEQHCLEMVRHTPQAVATSEPRRLPSRAVLLTGPGVTTWGHWLVDFLPRLFLMERAGWDITELTWVITRQTPKFARELLRLLGIPERCLAEYDPAFELLRVDELMVPTNLSAGPLMHPLFNEAVAWLRRRLHPTLIDSAGKQDKIFLSRSSSAFQRMLGNRDIIEIIARAAGYAVVDPALMAVPDQLGLFFSATRIAGEYGSGLHTSIFAPAGAIVICLRGPKHTAGVIQNGLAKACAQKIGYVFGDAIPDSPIEAYTITPDLFRLSLDYAELAI